MAVKTRENLREALRAKRLENLYLLHGPEGFLRDSAARAITDLALQGASLREFNEASYSLAQMDAQQALATVEQLPLMAERPFSSSSPSGPSPRRRSRCVLRRGWRTGFSPCARRTAC